MTSRFVAAAMFAMWIVPGAVSAQTLPDAIQRDLKPGQKVSVIDQQGSRIRGRIVEVSGDALIVERGRERTSLPHDSVVRIDAVDDLRKGTLIGAIVGGGLFALEAWAASQDGFTLNAGGYALVASIYGGAGAAIGAGVDALVGGDRPIYQRSGGRRVAVAPVLGRSRAGAVVGISW